MAAEPTVERVPPLPSVDSGWLKQPRSLMQTLILTCNPLFMWPCDLLSPPEDRGHLALLETS